MVRKSFLKAGISSNLNKSEDDYMWNKCEGESEKENVDEYIPLAWDTDENVPQKQ